MFHYYSSSGDRQLVLRVKIKIMCSVWISDAQCKMKHKLWYIR